MHVQTLLIRKKNPEAQQFPGFFLNSGTGDCKGTGEGTGSETASCFGAAILGAVAGGAYENIHAASQSMVQYQYTISPDAENHRRYQFFLNKYEEAYVLMKDWMHEVYSYALK